jgi:hypothetical protein
MMRSCPAFLRTTVHPSIIFAFFVRVTLVSALPHLEFVLPTAFVQIDQEVPTLVSVRERKLGGLHGRHVLCCFGFCFGVVAASHDLVFLSLYEFDVLSSRYSERFPKCAP